MTLAPLQFCPYDGYLLVVAPKSGFAGGGAAGAAAATAGGSGQYLQFACTSPSCTYRYTLRGTLTQDVALRRKEVDDVLGGEDAWENVDKTLTKCPTCGHTEAYYMQIQIRSADEPMSTFYKCVKCGARWREG
eukprot:PRCOL_00000799-RA